MRVGAFFLQRFTMLEDEDFLIAYEEISDMLNEMMEQDMQPGPVVVGALTAAIYRLLLGSPDPMTVSGVLASALHSATLRAKFGEAIFEDSPSDEYH